MDWLEDAKGGRSSRLRLARSQDRGRPFSVQTVTTHRVSDKPELAKSSDGLHLYIVYESGSGPIVVASHDGGSTWAEPLVIVAGDGRHFWPEALAVAPDGSIWLAVPSMSDSDIAKRKQTTVTLHVFRSDDRGRTWQDFEISRSPRLPGACPHSPNLPVKVPRITLAVDGRNRAHVVYTEGATPQQPYGLFYQSSSDGGRTWSSRHVVSAAPRPQSADSADHDYVMVSTSKDGRVCAVWVDDRRGALDVWVRCSTDAGRSWRRNPALGSSRRRSVQISERLQGVLRPLRRRGHRRGRPALRGVGRGRTGISDRWRVAEQRRGLWPRTAVIAPSRVAKAGLSEAGCAVDRHRGSRQPSTPPSD